MQIWTVGHSTLAIEQFIALLQSQSVKSLADVRQFPMSRRHPQFNRENLAASLSEHYVEYHWIKELGGRRSPRPDSRNLAWKNSSFRGYADYMETAPFRHGIDLLVQLASSARTAIMCAEALWWRCHRALISDYLKAEGIEVRHIRTIEKAEDHPFTPAARLIDGKLSYSGLEL